MISGLHFSPAGDAIVSFSSDGTARVWSTRDGTLLRTFEDHHTNVRDAAFVQGGRTIISIGDDGHMFAWAPEGGKTQVLFSHQRPLISMTLLASNEDIIVRDAQGEIWRVTQTGQATLARASDGVEITDSEASRDGTMFAIGTEEGAVVIYRVATWEVLRTFKFGGSIREVSFSQDGQTILITSEGGYIHFVSLIVSERPGGGGQRQDRARCMMAAADDAIAQEVGSGPAGRGRCRRDS